MFTEHMLELLFKWLQIARVIFHSFRTFWEPKNDWGPSNRSDDEKHKLHISHDWIIIPHQPSAGAKAKEALSVLHLRYLLLSALVMTAIATRKFCVNYSSVCLYFFMSADTSAASPRVLSRCRCVLVTADRFSVDPSGLNLKKKLNSEKL